MIEALRSPFSPLPIQDESILYYLASIINEDEYVEISFSDLTHFECVDPVEIISDFNIRFITKKHISSDRLVLPPDSYNFSNFDLDTLDLDQNVALNKVADFYKRLSLINPQVSKEQIVFSMNKQTIFVIPRITKDK